MTGPVGPRGDASAARPSGQGGRRVWQPLAVAGLLLVLSGIPGSPAVADTAPPSEGTPATVGAQSLPTTQIDGVAWTQAVVGDIVFVGGEFSSARPAGAEQGTNESPRSNLLAYRLSTGELIDGFAPQVNGAVRTLEVSPEGDRLYVGGNFTSIDGANRYRFAVYNTATMKPVTSVQPTINSRVDDIAVTADRVYLVGRFTSMNRQARSGVAVMDRSSGELLPWAPVPVNGIASSVAVSPDGATVALAGNFYSINRRANTAGFAGVSSADSTELRSWPINRVVTNRGRNALVSNLSSDGGSLYGTASSYGVRSALEGTFRLDWASGRTEWIADCHGDAYGIAALDGAVYVAGHSYYCGNIGGMPKSSPINYRRGIALSEQATGVATADPYGYLNVAGQPSPTQLVWYPDFAPGSVTSLKQGPWSVATGSGYVVYAGEFPTVSGVPQQGLARFTSAGTEGSTTAPAVSKGRFVPTARAEGFGRVRLDWTANYDLDSERLRYDVIRDGNRNAPVFTTEMSSTFWDRPGMKVTDTGVSAGEHRYRLRVTDPDGNVVWGDTVTVMVW
ncbi:YncE family protein [Mycetocola reblochoni]|uniref:Fibronectin type III domain protein n=2 Tax=Mycetocola reblochoni TaxID=331618 RepID=A0A1R4IG57_9MICO|nr:hypothetical protein [Mycetocola reblochoni]RLP68960.1 hypothetical protein D9V30_08790 [Mycetocola reblochoni]SJN18800.1 hypothetical protein FM119_01635 [Mycetocola reblochoni REB411]